MVDSNTTLVDAHTIDLRDSERWMEVVATVWLFLIVVLGVLENGVILFVLAKDRQVVTKNDIPVVAMLINCLLRAAIGAPLPLVAELSGGWYVYLSEAMCTFAAFTVYLLGLASLYILLDITLWRYITITNPIQSLQLTTRHALIGVLLSYAVAAIFAISPLLGFGSYGLEAHGTSCGLAWTDRRTTTRAFLVVILLGCFLLPMMLIIMSYTVIFKVVKNSSIFPSEDNGALRTGRQSKKERKLLRLSFMMVAAYLVCWTPYAVVSFYVAFGDPGDLHPLVTRIPSLLAKSEILLNPVLYALQNAKIRNKVFRLMPVPRLQERSRISDDAGATMQMATVMSLSVVPGTSALA